MMTKPEPQRYPLLLGMVLVFVLVHIGFHATYIRHFPNFEGFEWVHHLHGALMGAWVMLLVVQPFLVLRKKMATHRLLGKLSYGLAPLMVASMVLVAKINFHKGDAQFGAEEVFAKQSNTWMQIFLFTCFYALAIAFRRKTNFHLRFMVATGILMAGPAMGRILLHYGPSSLLHQATLIPLAIKTTVAICLLGVDLFKKNNWVPNALVVLGFLLADGVYAARYSDAWQGFGQVVIHLLY